MSIEQKETNKVLKDVLNVLIIIGCVDLISLILLMIYILIQWLL